jgi:hypothetical protein
VGEAEAGPAGMPAVARPPVEPAGGAAAPKRLAAGSATFDGDAGGCVAAVAAAEGVPSVW